MSHLNRCGALFLGFVALAMTIAAGTALAFDKFEGAWALEGNTCDRVFIRKNNVTEFVNYSGERAGGFIVTGDNIDGAQAKCKILSRKEIPEGFKFVLACRQEIMFDRITVAMKVVNEDTIERYDPDFADIRTQYRRCKF